jgi:hypothetical protein
MELGIRFKFGKTSEFRTGKGGVLNPQATPYGTLLEHQILMALYYCMRIFQQIPALHIQ